MTTHTTADGAVTDTDPDGPLYVIASVEVTPVPAEEADSCGLDEGQTHVTLVTFDEVGTHPALGWIDDDAVPVIGDLDEARNRVNAEAGYRLYRLVPVTDEENGPIR